MCLEANQEAHRLLLTANQPELNSLWVLRQKLASFCREMGEFDADFASTTLLWGFRGVPSPIGFTVVLSDGLWLAGYL
ncbi:MAG TPA: hypothetical protein VK639_22445, partial [Terriglobales bacterium]|nr:hypothetical protein [Terriglobales bacterium]